MSVASIECGAIPNSSGGKSTGERKPPRRAIRAVASLGVLDRGSRRLASGLSGMSVMASTPSRILDQYRVSPRLEETCSPSR